MPMYPSNSQDSPALLASRSHGFSMFLDLSFCLRQLSTWPSTALKAHQWRLWEHYKFPTILSHGFTPEADEDLRFMASALCSNTSELKVGQIDDVQELHRTRPTVIPDRYVRDPSERPALSPLPLACPQVPVIDLSKLVCGGCAQNQEEMAKLTAACEEWGFFQLINHGVEEELLRSMEQVAKEFFMLPLEEKEKYPMPPGGFQGYGHAFIFSEEQKLDWCNMLALGIRPAYIRIPQLWPTKPAALSGTLETYSTSIRRLCQTLLVLIARSLGLSPAYFNDMFGEPVQAVRMNYYPACARPDLVLGLSAHSDGSALTVLQQDASFAGLQIIKDDAWVPVRPIAGALVINIGDTIEVLTNGKYKSVEHRAVTDEAIDRLSLITFYAPSYDLELGPVPELVGDQQPLRYRRYNHGEYSRHYVASKLEGKKALEFAKIQTSN